MVDDLEGEYFVAKDGEYLVVEDVPVAVRLGLPPHLRCHALLSHTIHSSITFRMSTAPQNRQLFHQ